MIQQPSSGFSEQKTNDDNIVPKVGRFYHLSSAFRILPGFFIIGVQKGGTTSLAAYLQQHPEVIPAQRKDIFYFNNPVHYSKGLNWYKAHFALKPYQWLYNLRNGTTSVTFDSTPNYFEAPLAAERLHSDFPKARLILLLRNPVERAWSSYQMARRFGFEELEFEEALEKEEERLLAEEAKIGRTGGHNYVYQRLSYQRRGIYIHYIKKWFELFPAGNILVLKSEDLFEAPQQTYDQVTSFLGLSGHKLESFENFNPGRYSEQMKTETRAQLAAFYEPYNRELYQFLGKNYGWS